MVLPHGCAAQGQTPCSLQHPTATSWLPQAPQSCVQLEPPAVVPTSASRPLSCHLHAGSPQRSQFQGAFPTASTEVTQPFLRLVGGIVGGSVLSHLGGCLAQQCLRKALPAKPQDAMTVWLGKLQTRANNWRLSAACALKLAPWISTRLGPQPLSGEPGTGAVTEEGLISLPICSTG